MTLTQQILNNAASLFDVVSYTRVSHVDSLLILGLESTPERNLDDFGYVDGHFRMYGFEKHVSPRLDSLLKLIRGRGLHAEPVGQYGYPLQGEINVKGEAIHAGLGKRGKNSLVLHPVYGPRLRFAVVLTDALLEPPTTSILAEGENPLCRTCSTCVDACPVGILEAYRMLDPRACLSDSDLMAREQEHLIPCDLCVKLCPVGRK